MNYDELAELWRSQAGKMPSESDELISVLRDEYHREERRVFWICVQEVIPALILFVIFGVCGLVMETGNWALFTAGFFCLGIGAFLLGSIIRQRRRQSDYGDSVIDQLRRAVAQVKHREWLYRNILWWYLLPGAIGWGVVVYEMMLKDGLAVFDILYVAIAFVFFAWVYWGNRRFAATRFRPVRMRLENLLHELELSS